ncbi:DUF4388 domain-containing protein [Pendulispora albinea]|uniref:J domain-containing protein n=1 Tax=Pendulispora albinea TaxID=2741071 RepID=A0ABZ2LZH3_9BACT
MNKATVFVSDPSVEAERVSQTLRGEGYTVVDVPLSMLVARVAVQRPRVVLVDADADGALEVVARMRELPDGDSIDVLYIGRAPIEPGYALEGRGSRPSNPEAKGPSRQTSDPEVRVLPRPAFDAEGEPHGSTGFVSRPVDIHALVRKVEALNQRALEVSAEHKSLTPGFEGEESEDAEDKVPSGWQAPDVSVVAARTPEAPPSMRSSPPPSSGPSSNRGGAILPPPSMRAERPSQPPPSMGSLPALASASHLHGGVAVRNALATRRMASVPGHLSSELSELLAEAEERVGYTNAHESSPPSPDEELEAVLPEEILAALDEPLVDDAEHELSESNEGPRATTSAGGGKHTTGIRRPTTSSGLAAASGGLAAASSGLAAASGGLAAPRYEEHEARDHHTHPAVPPPPPSARPVPVLASSPSRPPVPAPVPSRPPVPVPAPSRPPGAALASSRPPAAPEREAARTPPIFGRALASDALMDSFDAHPPPPAPLPSFSPPPPPVVPGHSPLPPPLAPGHSPLPPAPPPPAPPLPAARVTSPPHLPPSVLGEADAPVALARAIASRVTGTLCFESKDGVRRVVLREGDLVTCASGVDDESLIAYLVARGDLPREKLNQVAGRFATFGRHAGAALVAQGYLRQDQLWPVLRGHAEWILGRALLLKDGTAVIEPEPPGRLRGEPSVFGGSTGAEVFVEVLRRVVAPEDAILRMGGVRSRIGEGPKPQLLTECALGAAELAIVEEGRGVSIEDALETHADTDMGSVLYALSLLGVISVARSIGTSRHEEAPAAEIDALDVDAIRARVRTRLQLVDEGDYFAILGVPRNATGYEVRRAFLELRRAFEPARLLSPRLLDLAPDVNKIVEVLEEAYEILRDGARRERYRRAIDGAPGA